MTKALRRYALRIEYDGSDFHGWQRQHSDQTVQQCIEDAIHGLTGMRTTITGAGRTDAGVHAQGQVAHFDLLKSWAPARLADAINAHLRPARISVLQAIEVNTAFHARISATERCYSYRLQVRRAPLALAANQVWRVPGQLDVGKMQSAASHLLGRHDFTTFRSAHCQANSPVRTMGRIEMTSRHDASGHHVTITLTARSFLHRQIRSIVGSLVKVGQGAWSPHQIATALADRNRASCGPVAPAHGLYLVHVRYPNDPFGCQT